MNCSFTPGNHRWLRPLAFGLLVIGHWSLVIPAGRADERTRAAQSALAAKGFYFGTPDGQPGAPTSDALRRFQIRQGLPVSGNLDEATARALDLRPAAPTTPTTETDRDFLRQQGLAPVATPPPPTTPRPTPRPAASPRPAPTPALAPRAQNVFTNVPPPPPANADLSRAEAARFLRRFLTAGAGDDVAAEVACYAPEVFYFDRGRQNRRFITRDQNAYRRRWPFRRYELLGEPELLTREGNANTVRYRLRYEVQSPARVASGETIGEVTLRRTGDAPGPDGAPGLEIVAIRERTRGD